jgi:hypothetical protein
MVIAKRDRHSSSLALLNSLAIEDAATKSARPSGRFRTSAPRRIEAVCQKEKWQV